MNFINKMIFLNFLQTAEYLQGTSYFIIFLLMVIEGPIVTSAAAFLASLGFFNIFIIFILSLLGDLVGDCLHYTIGRYGGHKLIKKYHKKFSVTKKDLNKTEHNLNKHFGKTMFVIKFTPLFTTPGLILMGSLKIPLKKFIIYSLLITLPRTIFFILTGYYFGIAFDKIMNYYKIGGYIIVIFVIFVIISYLIFKKISSKIAQNIYKK